MNSEADVLVGALFERVDLTFGGHAEFDLAIVLLQDIGSSLGVNADEVIARFNSKRTSFDFDVWSKTLSAICERVGPAKFVEAARKILSQPLLGDPVIVVGPVLGKVTETSARILVELSHDGILICRVATVGEEKPTVTVKLPFTRGRPQAFVLHDLMPGTQYLVEFEGAKALVDSCSFRTVPAGGWQLSAGQAPRFAVASCNNVYITRQMPRDSIADLWHDLKLRIKDEGLRLDYMLHLGDNIYNDSDWHKIEKGASKLEGRMCKWGVAHTWLSSLDAKNWGEYTADIAELFRGAYRETWGHPATRWVLAHVPNLMIFDDHDIRDDWGDRPEDIQKDSLDWFLADIAYGTIQEYQQQLYDDVPRRGKPDYHFHAFGDIGFIFLDVRGCKTWNHTSRDEVSPMLGINQWRALEDTLAPCDKGDIYTPARDRDAESQAEDFGRCRALLVLAPEPVAYVSRTPTMVFGQLVVDDLLGQWSASKHQPEVPRLLNLLSCWRADKPGREVLLVGGDVHEGGWSDLVRQDSAHPLAKSKVVDIIRIRQLTTSAIANVMTRPHEAVTVGLTRNVASLVDGYDLSGGWRCRHYDWTNRRNYALVDVTVATAGILKVSIVAAYNLRNADVGIISSGKSDPYVIVSVGTQKSRTKTIRNNLNPVWTSEEFTFDVSKTDHSILFQVFDEDKYSEDDKLGKAHVGIHCLEPGRVHRCKESLGPGNGELELDFHFEPHVSTLGRKTCKHRCGMLAFGRFDTCCTRCRSADGPHADDCKAKNSIVDDVGPAVISGRLIASDGKAVEKLKLRSTTDSIFTLGQEAKATAKELKKHAGDLAGRITSVFGAGS